jgi:hypothetical protein
VTKLNRVTKLHLLSTVLGVMTLLMFAAIGGAAPFNIAAPATIKAATTLNLVEEAHGTHRSCRLGRVAGWGSAVRWHRHVGPSSRPVPC